MKSLWAGDVLYDYGNVEDVIIDLPGVQPRSRKTYYHAFRTVSWTH
jgi:hypothetical protein